MQVLDTLDVASGSDRIGTGASNAIEAATSQKENPGRDSILMDKIIKNEEIYI